MQLASRFASGSPALRSARPLDEDQIERVAPSIFAAEAHGSRSERYTHIPTIDVLRGLRREGFEPFFVCQTRVRKLDKREYTKHMIRLRHANDITGEEANEIVLLNSHDGTSSYQMMGGMFRFVCQNGMVCGDMVGDIRVRHKGDVVQDVIEGAFRVLDSFDAAEEQRDSMKALTLSTAEQTAFGRAALALKYDGPERPAPIAEDQLLTPRRFEDRGSDLWTTFNCVQENMMKGGLHGHTQTGRSTRTREVRGIDQNVKLNRALWILGAEMARLKA